MISMITNLHLRDAGGTGARRHVRHRVAAVVEQLCVIDGLDPPAWVGRAECRLPEPWFVVPGLSLRAWLLVSTPVPFKRRNIFGGDRLLTRV